MDSTALAAAVSILAGLIGGFIEAIRRGAFVARFAYDRESARADEADRRADRLEAALAIQTRTIEDQGRAIVEFAKTSAEQVTAIGKLDERIAVLVRKLADERSRADRGGKP